MDAIGADHEEEGSQGHERKGSFVEPSHKEFPIRSIYEHSKVQKTKLGEINGISKENDRKNTRKQLGKVTWVQWLQATRITSDVRLKAVGGRISKDNISIGQQQGTGFDLERNQEIAVFAETYW